MANQLSKILNYTVEVFDAMPLVNTIIIKDDDVVDVEKENVYPLVSIALITSPDPEIDLRTYKLRIGVYNQRDDRKIATPSKLMTDTNYIDNINICDTIANNYILELLKSHNVYNIGIVDDSVSDFEFKRKDERNALDGVEFEVTLYINQNNI